jgi:hypothetical protein
MAKHEIDFAVPTCKLGNTDISINIKKDGKKFGTITISRGNLEWYPKSSRKPHIVSWTVFDKIICEYKE